MLRLQIVQRVQMKYAQTCRGIPACIVDAPVAKVTLAKDTPNPAGTSVVAASVASVMASIVSVVAARFATVASVVHVVISGIVAGVG